MPTWKIQFGSGPAKIMDQAGVCEIQRRIVSQDADSVSLTFTNADLRRAIPHANGTRVRILRDDVGWFTGRVDISPRACQGGVPSLTMEVVNAWAEMDRIIYTRVLKFVDSSKIVLGSDLPADYPTVDLRTSAVLINEDDAGKKINTSDFLKHAVNFAINRGAKVQIGTVEPGVQVPREEFRDVVCTELIRACLRWTPDLTVWFNYATDPPTINVVKRRAKEMLNLDTQVHVLSNVNLTARPDLVIAGVTINYLRVHDRPSFQFKTLDPDFAGIDEGQQLSRTIELYGSRWNATQKLNDAEALPLGVAARLLESLEDLHYEGSVELVQQDCPAGSYLGRKLNLANSTPEWAAMNADIRGQTDTVSTGRTTIQLGPPPQLSYADFVELLRGGRPVDALTAPDQTSGALVPQTTPPPSDETAPNTPPSFVFAPEQPDVVLFRSTYRVFYSNGQNGSAGNDDVLNVYYSAVGSNGKPNGEKGAFAGTISAGAIIMGGVTDFMGIKVGRGKDKVLPAINIWLGGYNGSADARPAIFLTIFNSAGGMEIPPNQFGEGRTLEAGGEINLIEKVLNQAAP